MDYICFNRFTQKALCGEVNIPYGTKLDETNNVISYRGNPICYTKSQNAYDYFARNDDGKGLERGKLTAEIIKLLNNRNDGKYQDRWDRIWGDLSLLKYKRPEQDDYWLWNYDFFNASIEELNRIRAVILEG